MNKNYNIAVTNNGQHYNVTVNDYSMPFRTFYRTDLERIFKTAITYSVVSAFRDYSCSNTLMFELDSLKDGHKMFLLNTCIDDDNNSHIDIYDCHDEDYTGHDFYDRYNFARDVALQVSDEHGNFIPFSIKLSSGLGVVTLSGNTLDKVHENIYEYDYCSYSDLNTYYQMNRRMVDGLIKNGKLII